MRTIKQMLFTSFESLTVPPSHQASVNMQQLMLYLVPIQQPLMYTLRKPWVCTALMLLYVKIGGLHLMPPELDDMVFST